MAAAFRDERLPYELLKPVGALAKKVVPREAVVPELREETLGRYFDFGSGAIAIRNSL